MGRHEEKAVESSGVTRVVEKFGGCGKRCCDSFRAHNWYIGGMQCRVRPLLASVHCIRPPRLARWIQVQVLPLPDRSIYISRLTVSTPPSCPPRSFQRQSIRATTLNGHAWNIIDTYYYPVYRICVLYATACCCRKNGETCSALHMVQNVTPGWATYWYTTTLDFVHGQTMQPTAKQQTRTPCLLREAPPLCTSSAMPNKAHEKPLPPHHRPHPPPSAEGIREAARS